jgi:hypothetical protein
MHADKSTSRLTDGYIGSHSGRSIGSHQTEALADRLTEALRQADRSKGRHGDREMEDMQNRSAGRFIVQTDMLPED